MGFARAGQHLDAVLGYLGDDGRVQAADRTLFAQFGGPGTQGLARQARLGATVAVTLVISDQAFMYRMVGDFLQVARHRRGDAETFGVGLAAITANHLGAGHFGDIGCIHFWGRHVIAGVQRLGYGTFISGLVDLAQFVHAAQDPVTAFFTARRVGQRVEARRCLGQAGDHRHLRQAGVTNRLAIVDLGRGLDAVGAVAQVDLVDVQLEDFILGQLAFDLQRQQDFGGLAGKAAFAGEEEVLRHLHGDGAATRLNVSTFYQLRGCTHQAAGVYAVVVGEIIVFGRQQSADEIGWNVGETDRCAAHFAELRDQFFIAAVDPQRNLQLDTSEGLYGGQTRTKVEVGPAEYEQQPANDGDNGVPEKLQQTNQGFWISREKNELRVGDAWQTMDRPGQQIKSGKKRWALKHFSAWGVIREP